MDPDAIYRPTTQFHINRRNEEAEDSKIYNKLEKNTNRIVF